MHTFYTSHNNELSHCEAIRKVEIVLRNIDLFIDHTPDVNTIKSDLFGNTFSTNKQWKVTEGIIEISEMVKIMLGQVKIVLERQYSKYLELSAAELMDMEAHTTTAPVHNIISEEQVGMFSAAQQRAPHATILYTASKIKSIKNRTLDKLMLLTEDDRVSKISMAVTLSGQVKKLNLVLIKTVHRNIVKSIERKKEKKQATEKKKLENKIKQLEVESDICEVLDCSLEQADIVKDIINYNICDRFILHTWLSDDNKLTTWHGKVLGTGELKEKVYTVCYWQADESLDDGEDYYMSPAALAADYLCKELSFM